MNFLQWPWPWSLDPAVLAGLLIGCAAYIRGWSQMGRRRKGWGRGRFFRSMLFLFSLLAIFIALESPLDAASEQYFSVHMLQHVLLMHVAAPLLVLSNPLPILLFALPGSYRSGLGLWWARGNPVRMVWRWISRPAAVWIFYAFSLWLWHWPVLYELALENSSVHILEHLIFFFSALLFWQSVVYYFGRSARRRGVGVLFIFLQFFESGVLGGLITYAQQPWYSSYQTASLASMTPLADQQIAGYIMWVADGVVFLSALLWMAQKWRRSLMVQA